MLTLLAIINKASGPYWNLLRKKLAKEKIAPLTITHSSNLIGHPIGILILIFSGMFLLPNDPLFYIFWFALIAISAIVSIFIILGLLETKFFTTQIIGSLGFISSSVFANIFLGEQLNAIKIFCLFLSILGVVFFAWPKKVDHFFAFDRGIVFTILAVILGGIASVLYKLATFHVIGFGSLLAGRFVVDLIGWTIVWLISMWIIKKNPISDLTNLARKKSGQIFVIGVACLTLLDAWLIYKLPVSTLAMIGTLAFPVSYFISYFKYKEKITPLMWLGTICIIISIILFILA
jgi:drug/metabolite transporter (DMT)-like permease